MKNVLFPTLILITANAAAAQHNKPTANQQKAMIALIDDYSLAREIRDTVLLKKILTGDVDQLVSTGEWRTGIWSAVEGMLKSSANRLGTRTLTVDKIKMVNATCAIVDCRVLSIASPWKHA